MIADYVGRPVIVEFADCVMIGFFGIKGDKCVLYSAKRQDVFYNVVYVFPESEIVKIDSLLLKDADFKAKKEEGVDLDAELKKEMAVVGVLPSAQEILDEVIEEEKLAESDAYPNDFRKERD